MMKTLIFVLLACVAAEAAPIFSLPNNGLFSAPAGTLLSIGFVASSDATNYVVVNAVDGSATGIGALVDVLSNYVSAELYAYAPQAPNWTESFTPGRPLGPVPGALATLFIPANLSIGTYSGSLQISFSLFDLDPFIAVNAVEVGQGAVTLPFQVNVSALNEVPEPALGWMAGLLCGLGLVQRRWRSARS
jgi:hypothetical protein